MAHGFQIGQGFEGGRTERNRPRPAALSGVDHERLRRPVPVLGTVAHQLAGSQLGEGQHATADLRRGRGGPGLPLDRRASPIRHGRQDALEHVVGEPARLRGGAGERLDVSHQVRGITTVERPVQRGERLAVVVAGRRRMGPPQIGERGPHIAGRDGVAAEVAEEGRPPLQLLAALGHEARPVGNLPQEGLDVGGEGSRGSLQQSE